MQSKERTDLDQQSEEEMRNTKTSDSGYSTGRSKSQSQKSESSKSMQSNSTTEEFSQPHSSNPFEKTMEHKKKKNKGVRDSAEKDDEQEVIDQEHKETDETVESAKRNSIVSVSDTATDSSGPPPSNGIVESALSRDLHKEATKDLNRNDHTENVSSFWSMDYATTMEAQQTGKIIKSIDGNLNTQLESIKLDETQKTSELTLIPNIKKKLLESISGQFCLAVSMHDGKILYTTSTLTDVLGFPSHMLIGRSFIDFVHQKDKFAFANHITLAFEKTWKSSSNTFFCYLRKYRGLKNSVLGIEDRADEYIPIKLSLCFREIKSEITDTLLIITATTVKTAYKYPNEIKEVPKFSTRHLANTYLSHIDIEAVSYLGYLPQDMIGRSVFEFYHPEDLPILKEIYKSLLRIKGSTDWCKPYRFRTQNGSFVTLETEWSSFINPWSKKLEFITGQHRLLKGPLNPDVFAPLMEQQRIPEKVLKENQIIQEEIKRILSEPVLRISDLAKQQVSKECKDLSIFMESVMNNITKPEHQKLEEFSIQEENLSMRDSVMLGEISPHHDYYDSKSSSETPPSYKQLNFNENLQRFFDSKPKTLTVDDEKSDFKIRSLLRDDKKTLLMSTKNEFSINESEHCSGSDSELSNASNYLVGINNAKTKTFNNRKNYASATVLTKAVLRRHNKNMEKVLIKRHRDLKVKCTKIKEMKVENAIEKLQGNTQNHHHGMKQSKSFHCENNELKHNNTEPRSQKKYKNNTNESNKSSLWTPISAVTINPLIQPQGRNITSNTETSVAGIIPMCFTTSLENRAINALQNTKIDQMPLNDYRFPADNILKDGNAVVHHQYDMGMGTVPFTNAFPIYSIMGCGTPPLLYSPVLMAPQAPHVPQVQPTVSKSESVTSLHKYHRPASQTKSVKVEIGSTKGSTARSKYRKKDKLLFGSLDKDDSQCFLRNVEKSKKSPKLVELPQDTSVETGEESSYSYSSFLKTDDSMKSLEETEPQDIQKKRQWDEIKKEEEEIKSIRKEPFWLEKIDLTPELVYQYQLSSKEMTNVLQSDLEILKSINQPKLVDEQLQQLYSDLEMKGLSTKLKIEEDLLSSNNSNTSSGSEEPKPFVQKKNRKKKKHFDTFECSMLSDESMPLPSPVSAISNEI